MQTSKTVAQTLLGETAHFGFCLPQIGFFRGVGEVPEIFSLSIRILLVTQDHMQKFKIL